MQASDLIKRSFETAKSKGWHDKERSPAVIAALFHSEVSEFVEDVRAGKPDFYESEDGAIVRGEHGEDVILKPSGQAIELIDLAIRIGDFCGKNGWLLRFGQHDTTEGLIGMWKDESSEETREFIMRHQNFDDPIEFADNLHTDISTFSKEMRIAAFYGDVSHAQARLTHILESLIVYFVYRGWDFDAMFATKSTFNELRPYRHGGKSA